MKELERDDDPGDKGDQSGSREDQLNCVWNSCMWVPVGGTATAGWAGAVGHCGGLFYVLMVASDLEGGSAGGL